MLEREENEEKDIVLAKFIAFMKIVFHNQSINYFRNLKMKNSWEKELKESNI